MEIKDLIRQKGWEDQTASYILTQLLDPIEVKDTTLYTSKKLTEILTIEEYRLVAGTLAAAAAQDPLAADAQGWLRSTGIDFSTDLTYGMLSQLKVAGNWTDSIFNRIVAIGRRSTNLLGGGTTDLQAVTTALNVAKLERDKQVALDTARNVFADFETALANWDGQGDAPQITLG